MLLQLHYLLRTCLLLRPLTTPKYTPGRSGGDLLRNFDSSLFEFVHCLASRT